MLVNQGKLLIENRKNNYSIDQLADLNRKYLTENQNNNQIQKSNGNLKNHHQPNVRFNENVVYQDANAKSGHNSAQKDKSISNSILFGTSGHFDKYGRNRSNERKGILMAENVDPQLYSQKYNQQLQYQQDLQQQIEQKRLEKQRQRQKEKEEDMKYEIKFQQQLQIEKVQLNNRYNPNAVAKQEAKQTEKPQEEDKKELENKINMKQRMYFGDVYMNEKNQHYQMLQEKELLEQNRIQRRQYEQYEQRRKNLMDQVIYDQRYRERHDQIMGRLQDVQNSFKIEVRFDDHYYIKQKQLFDQQNQVDMINNLNRMENQPKFYQYGYRGHNRQYSLSNLYTRNNQSHNNLYGSYNMDSNMNNYSMGTITPIQMDNQLGLDSNVDIYDNQNNKQFVGDSYYIKDEFDKGYLNNGGQKKNKSKENSQFMNQKTEFVPLSTSQIRDQDDLEDQDNEFKERKVKTDYEDQYNQQMRLSQEQQQIQQQQVQLQQQQQELQQQQQQLQQQLISQQQTTQEANKYSEKTRNTMKTENRISIKSENRTIENRKNRLDDGEDIVGGPNFEEMRRVFQRQSQEFLEG